MHDNGSIDTHTRNKIIIHWQNDFPFGDSRTFGWSHPKQQHKRIQCDAQVSSIPHEAMWLTQFNLTCMRARLDDRISTR